MEWETLKLEGDGPIRHIVLNRPERHNAVNWQLLKDLTAACLAIEELPDCRCVILRGAGPSFCSGADLKDGMLSDGTPGDGMRRAKSGARAIDLLADLTPVTIAAVHGHAIGGGACLAMACDFLIGAAGARVCIREVSLGISLSWHSVPNVVHLVGPSRAKEMILFGETYDAATLLDYGFFNRVVPDAELGAASEELAARVLRQPPLPVQMSKATINALVKALDRSVCNLDEPGVTFTARTEDAREAARTLASDETPVWEAQ